jgi:hypothetical protein
MFVSLKSPVALAGVGDLSFLINTVIASCCRRGRQH